MFKKVLVANRGEIAVRVMRTLREMGIRSVAVYSEVDRGALHVRMADEAVAIGPAPSTESYLRVDRIIDACRETGAEAIHPGYGFLSEKPALPDACKAAGITFIGPDASAMRAMGSKTAARERMSAAGVPVVPGAKSGSIAELTREAERIGYPVMLKAANGGGGKGMRLVERAADLASAYERAQSEARTAFGDDTVYLERALIRPRHVEIQVLGDRFGNIVHLYERDCSIQRRNQKLIEETPSPSPLASRETIAKMGEIAVRAARAVDYHSAGTIEFLLSETGEFYFLEMNARLQVEHPITELTTGIDLVREMVRIAAGEKLGYTQADIMRRGHAIECRVCAEDPSTGFLPSPGRITSLQVPSGPGVRDDSGAYEGAEIPSYYDPLVSKLVVWAPNRADAIARMRRALDEYSIGGIRSNLPFHRRVFRDEAFVRGEYDTGFLARRSELAVFEEQGTSDDALGIALAAAAALAEIGDVSVVTNTAPDAHLSAWRRASPRAR